MRGMSPTTTDPDVWVPRKAHRSRGDRYVSGVAGGVAEHLGVDPVLVRGFFVVTTLAGVGLGVYVLLWLLLPMDTRPEEASPGVEAATRRGMRPGRTPGRRRDLGILVALGAVVLGVAGLGGFATGNAHLLGPAAFAVLGVSVLWVQADEAQRERWRHTTERIGIGRILLGSGGLAAWARLVAGAFLLVSALVIFAAQSGQVSVARDMVVAGVLGMGGLAVVLGPWLFSLASELTDERAERIRTQERADVAAHLHDSVLQTLAMIQRSASDPTTVARLARAQERDLRQWLYGDQAAPVGTLAGALRAMAAEAEDLHGVPVEVVTVGDLPVTPELVPLVGATRESVLNAVRHSGAARVDLYAEVGRERVEVFVRDRGRGFDLAAVPPDRQGVRGSVVGRMERHGGTAEVRTGPDSGTEVRLGMPVHQHDDPPTDHQPEEAR